VAVSFFVKLADLFTSPKTTLPWLINAVNGPSWLISLLVPVKESGSLLPQAFINTFFLSRYESRTGLWRIGASLQAVGIAGLVIVSYLLNADDNIATNLFALLFLLLLILTSIGRSCCSLAMKDIQANYVEKGRRGKLLGIAGTFSALLTLAVTAVWELSSNELSSATILYLLALSSLSFLITIVIMAPLSVSIDSENQDTKTAWKTQINAVFKHKNTRHLLINRVLMLHTALVPPYLIAQQAKGDDSSLFVYIGLSALASLISSFLWGKLSDRSAITTLRLAGILSGFTLLLFYFSTEQPSSMAVSIVFFIIMLCHEGVRTGRKTYLLDVTESANRRHVVSIVNTAVGLCLLGFGILYALIHQQLNDAIIPLMGAMILAGALHTWLMQAEK
jgi:hypothetical protein